jgi:hypothetical protein
MRLIIFLVVFSFLSNTVDGQGSLWEKLNSPPDSSFVASYRNDLIVRLYTSRKYMGQQFLDGSASKSLNYQPSNNYLVGFGINYKLLGINAGFSLPSMRKSMDKYGKTSFFDLQSHVYLRRITFDLFSHVFWGQYLSNSSNILTTPPERGFYYARPDIRSYAVNAEVNYNFNYSRYSLRAPFLQDEWQKRNAGSFFAGGGIYWDGSDADSSFVPSGITVPDFYGGVDFKCWELLALAATGGYAYTFVIDKRFFVVLSAIGGIGVGRSMLADMEGRDYRTYTPFYKLTERFGFGYQYGRMYVGATCVNMDMLFNSPLDNARIHYRSGNIRVNIAYRFSLKKEIKILPGMK